MKIQKIFLFLIIFSSAAPAEVNHFSAEFLSRERSKWKGLGPKHPLMIALDEIEAESDKVKSLERMVIYLEAERVRLESISNIKTEKITKQKILLIPLKSQYDKILIGASKLLADGSLLKLEVTDRGIEVISKYETAHLVRDLAHGDGDGCIMQVMAQIYID